MPIGGISDFMLGLLSLEKGLPVAADLYNSKKNREAKKEESKIKQDQSQQEIDIERQKLADQENPESPTNKRYSAESDEAKARARLLDRTDPNKSRGGGSFKDIPLGALRAMHDTYLNRSKSLPLGPEEQAEFQGITTELNTRLGIKPGQVSQPTPAPEGFSLMKFLTGGGSANAQPAAAQKPKWQQYDQ